MKPYAMPSANRRRNLFACFFAFSELADMVKPPLHFVLPFAVCSAISAYFFLSPILTFFSADSKNWSDNLLTKKNKCAIL
jgi:hypothetical protein